ncbi:Rsm7p [Saccharomyces cerevisiae x Saccharomyces kudriavzevii VIN7]|uniref:Rsm7p n=1 Tax=Saccharomyces cerevisiae x Saccharomyces kudriavzevii (strain VIN7) TaxID=1095631 RepID=H0GX51_SACCK|nr:Rsm7p [Saccharomyces cerevisiae x Saccharomyces kudriavzevii VIN7]
MIMFVMWSSVELLRGGMGYGLQGLPLRQLLCSWPRLGARLRSLQKVHLGLARRRERSLWQVITCRKLRPQLFDGLEPFVDLIFCQPFATTRCSQRRLETSCPRTALPQETWPT